MMLLSMLLSLFVIVIYGMIYNGIPQNWLIAIAGCFGVGLIVLSFQYTAFYAIGKMKSQQFAGIIMMVPGFILLFGANFIIEKIMTNMPSEVDWIVSNLNIFAILIMVSGIAVWGLGIIVTTKIIEKRDFI